ncbi:M48 family metalloprotease, partial [Ottowia pentelensis]
MSLPFHSSPPRAARLARRAALAVVSTAALLLGALPAAAQGGAAGGALPSLGEAGEMTPLAERKLGDAIARELYRDPDYIDDPVIGEYVDGVWRALLAGARTRGELPPELDERFAWQVFLGRDRSINAFALPGGYFGLNLGLVGVVRTRDELASVLGHEMSHVTQRHIARLLGQQSRQTPLLIAAMVAGAIAASKNPQAGAALAVGGQAAIAQQQLNFSRDM